MTRPYWIPMAWREDGDLDRHENSTLDTKYDPSEVEDDSTKSEDTLMVAQLLAHMRLEEFSTSNEEEVGENEVEKPLSKPYHVHSSSKEEEDSLKIEVRNRIK